LEVPYVRIGQLEYVEARLAARVVGGQLTENPRQGTATLKLQNQLLELTAGRPEVEGSGGPFRLAAPSLVQNGRFLVSVDFVPVALGARFGAAAVSWDRQRLEALVSPGRTTVNNIRVGVYPTYTRIVLDVVGRVEWSTSGGRPDEPVSVVVPGGVLAAGLRSLVPRGGIVRQVDPIQQPGGVEIRLTRVRPNVRIRTFTLSDPSRLVIDVIEGSPSDVERPAVASTAGPPPASGSAPAQGPAPPSPTRAPAPQTDMPAAKEDIRPARANTAGASPAPAERGTPPPQPVTAGSEAPPAAAGRNGTGAHGGNGGSAETSVLTIVLDPGHGGHDTGAIGPSGLMEKDVVLDLALRLRRLLVERLGARVLMTRTEDVFVPLPERTAIANRAKVDFFISIHANAATKRNAVGFETYYFTREPSDSDARASAQRENLVIDSDGARGSDQDSLLRITLADMAVTRDMRESGELAELVLTSLDKLLRVENRGVKSGPFYVLATAAMPAILVESAFITNPREERKLQRTDYRQRIAEALFEGIAKYKVRYERRVGMAGAASPPRDS
jgi:N-acetylmuramoyl-L-alanine amidase